MHFQRNLQRKGILFFFFVLVFSFPISFLHGKNALFFIGVDPVSSSLGGTGISYAQTASTALFLNPATLASFGGSEVSAGFIFNTPREKNRGRKNIDLVNFSISFAFVIRLIPERMNLGVGIGTPIYDKQRFKNRFGTITTIDQEESQEFNFSVGTSYRPIDILSFGLAFEFMIQKSERATADSDNAMGMSTRLGFALDFSFLNFGAFFRKTLIIPSHAFDSASQDIESPMQAGAGVTLFFLDKKLFFSADAKGIFWSLAKTYREVYKNQWVLGLGIQYGRKIVGRIGYNYSSDPDKYRTVASVREPLDVSTPHYFSVGMGISISDKWSMDLNVGMNLNERDLSGFEKQFFEIGAGARRKL